MCILLATTSIILEFHKIFRNLIKNIGKETGESIVFNKLLCICVMYVCFINHVGICSIFVKKFLKKSSCSYLFYWYFETVRFGHVVLTNLQKRVFQSSTVTWSQQLCRRCFGKKCAFSHKSNLKIVFKEFVIIITIKQQNAVVFQLYHLWLFCLFDVMCGNDHGFSTVWCQIH